MSADSIIPASFRRNVGTPELKETAVPSMRDQRTLDFMDHHHNLEARCHDQAIQLGEAAVEKEVQRLRIEGLETELAKARLECTMYQRGYFALHSKIGAFASIGADQMKSLAGAAIRILEQANEDMRAAGIAPPPEPNPIDDHLAVKP